MDWHTIFASVTTSGVIATFIGYAIKKSFDRSVDLKFEQLKEQQKALINEEIRKRSLLYDQQFHALKHSLSLVYRLRNTVREIIIHVEDRDQRGIYQKRDQLISSIEEIQEVIYDERATLPESLFMAIHNLKYLALELDQNFLDLLSSQKKVKHKEQVEKIKGAYKDIDELYSFLSQKIQDYLGVSVEG